MSVIRCRVRQVLHHLARTMTLSLALVGGVLTPTGAADISYVYDQAGRLLAVIDPTTDTASMPTSDNVNLVERVVCHESPVQSRTHVGRVVGDGARHRDW